ncbi:Hypothetical protein A7982_13365 [Minicystis rosea]|nr:Hypothetical protein A7982_13365 [Minicystis rosea]
MAQAGNTIARAEGNAVHRGRPVACLRARRIRARRILRERRWEMMKRRGAAGSSDPRQAMLTTAVTMMTTLAAGCGGDVTHVDAGTDAGTGGKPQHDAGVTYQPPVGIRAGKADKIDVLLMIDNSRSMADKAQVLSATLPDLVRGLVNPPCVDDGGAAIPMQPTGPAEACQAGAHRIFPPFNDIHIGVVTSSIGGHGSDNCGGAETFSCPGGVTNTSNDDHGHLITRLDPCAGGSVPSYQGKGFLAWDPLGKATPPGESSIGTLTIDTSTGAVTTGTPGLVPSLKDLVTGAGQIGCGFEASLEGWYRFLVDPDPYDTLELDPATFRATPKGVDNVLLQQRKDFLRPSSVLAIIGLTDENDCSIKEFGQFWFAAQARDPMNPNKNFYLPKARSECATNPNDTCCRSCGQDQTGCPPDPNCTGSLDAKTDDINLRCWDQKRRFGIDFLYPLDRYVTGLTQPLVPTRDGNMVPNPIFADLDLTDGDTTTRDPSMVLLTYIVGVPWQDLARDPQQPEKGLKNNSEMSKLDSNGHSTWNYVIGDPTNYVPPVDPLMIESAAPRTGVHPITGAALAPPSNAPGPGPNPINGHEYTPGTQNGVQVAADDLQYACIFDLPEPRDCTSLPGSCDCNDPQNDNPLCEPVVPGDPSTRTKQTRAKAYPGIRQLALVKALGAQGIAGSICPVQIEDPSQPTFGYRPVIQALVDRLAPIVTGGCLSRQLSPDAQGRVACAIIEAQKTNGLQGEACDAFCASQPGRIAVTAEHAAVRDAVLESVAAKAQGADCACEIPQLEGPRGCAPIASELGACQCDPSAEPTFDGKPVDGWCYVDASVTPSLGDPAVVASCPENEKRLLRFVGAGAPTPSSITMISCVSY